MTRQEQMHNMTPDERTQQELERPENWHAGWFGVYIAPADPRIWVPKRTPHLGWTLNFAHRTSWLVLAALVLLPVGIVALATLLAR